MGKKKSKTQKQKRKNRQRQNRQLVSVINEKKEITEQKLKTETKVAKQSEAIYKVKDDKVKLKKVKSVNKAKEKEKKKIKDIENIVKQNALKLKKLFSKYATKIKKNTTTFIKNLNKKELIVVKKKNVANKPKKIEKEVKVQDFKEQKKAKKKDVELPKLAEKNGLNIAFIKKIFWKIKNNLYVFFNALLIILFMFLLVGLIRTDSFSKGTIIYISALTGFLILIAISYNKYISGKIFSTVIAVAMFLAIYRLQYTYDFIRSLNTFKYEFRTYYVVTFDNNMNKSIYNFNNKKIGLMNNNSTNVSRMLNTKLDKVDYVIFDDVNELFNSFYKQDFKAVIVNENQYRYLVNNEVSNGRAVKILYEFDVNALK